MKNSYIAVIAIIVIIALGATIIVVSKEHHASAPPSTSTSTTTSNSSTNTPQTPTSNTANAIAIKDFGFNPTSITVAKGTTVTWTNNDSVAHTVTKDDSAGPDSGDVAPGSSYSYTFETPGTYHYHCKIHPEMTGTIIVS